MDTSKTPKKDNRQSPEKVALWKNVTLPALEQKATKEGYEVYYHDESTLQLCHNVVKTYGPRGETPILSSNDTKGHQYVCLASSINAAGKMFFQVREKAFKGEILVDYIKKILATTKRKIMIIWDNAPAHKSKEIKAFLNTTLGKRVWLANIPPYSPEFNPDELVWANLKRVKLANAIAKNTTELKQMASRALEKIKNDTVLIRSFFKK